jgi:hypothetical protein
MQKATALKRSSTTASKRLPSTAARPSTIGKPEGRLASLDLKTTLSLGWTSPGSYRT